MAKALDKTSRQNSFNTSASIEEIEAHIEAHKARIKKIWDTAKPAQIFGWYKDGIIEPFVLSNDPLTLDKKRAYYDKKARRMLLSDQGVLTPVGNKKHRLFGILIPSEYLVRDENGYPAVNEQGFLSIDTESKQNPALKLVQTIEGNKNVIPFNL